MALHLYFVRHGETEWSLTGRHTGRTEIPLTDVGEQEARKLGTRLPKESFTRVLSSPRLRARRTCELMGLAAVMEIDPELAEWDYGDYEGMRSVEIRKTRPDWNLFRDGCPGGESPAAISGRADRFIARVRQTEGVVHKKPAMVAEPPAWLRSVLRELCGQNRNSGSPFRSADSRRGRHIGRQSGEHMASG